MDPLRRIVPAITLALTHAAIMLVIVAPLRLWPGFYSVPRVYKMAWWLPIGLAGGLPCLLPWARRFRRAHWIGWVAAGSMVPVALTDLFVIGRYGGDTTDPYKVFFNPWLGALWAPLITATILTHLSDQRARPIAHGYWLVAFCVAVGMHIPSANLDDVWPGWRG